MDMILNTIRQHIERDTNLVDMATHIGKSRQTLYNYLDNLSQPDKDTALKIAQYLGVSMDELFILDTSDDGRTDRSERETKHGA